MVITAIMLSLHEKIGSFMEPFYRMSMSIIILLMSANINSVISMLKPMKNNGLRGCCGVPDGPFDRRIRTG